MRALLASARQLDPPRAPAKAPGEGWPIFVFSPGIWGSCEMYTQLCRDLASTGAIVVAIEHEDASGIYAINGTTGEPIDYNQPPKELKGTSGDGWVAFRHPYLEQRSEELSAVFAAVSAAVSGVQLTCSSPKPAEAQAVAVVLRCGDPNSMLLAAHSFGASSVMRYLRKLQERGEACPVIGALLMDVWAGCMAEADFIRPQVPVVFLLSEEWQQHPDHSAGNRKAASAAGDVLLSASYFPGCYHQWVSDSHLFLPGPVLRKLGVMGPGNWKRSYKATARAAALAVEALLEAGASGDVKGGGATAPATKMAAAGASLREKLARVDPGVMEPFT